MKDVCIPVPEVEIESFCRRWRVREFSFFGSVLREDFREDSDIDVLVSFEKDAGISLWDLVEMAEELEGILGRKVDLAIKEGLRNPYRRHAILTQRKVVYAA